MKVGKKTSIIDPAHELAPSLQKLIDKKVHNAALSCCENLKHSFFWLFSSPYRSLYNMAKQWIKDKESQPHWVPIKPYPRPGVLSASVVRHTDLENWLKRDQSTSTLAYGISEDKNTTFRWDDETIFVFGKSHPLDGLSTQLCDHLNEHGYSDEMAFLSNDYPCSINIEGNLYPSVEHYFHAIKFPMNERIYNKIVTANTPHQVRKIASKHYLEGSNREIQEMIRRMKLGLWSKFVDDQGKPTALGNKLRDTEERVLIKGNHRAEGHSDKRWGMEFDFKHWPELTLTGQNLLGRLLMQMRSYLQSGQFQ